MAAPVIIPELQFIDADGHPYAGGSLTTYVVGTSTPKATWVDPDGTALQTNPAILDAAGRCLMWGDGLYRLVLKDAAGNQIWDQPATTLVSAAMAPVVSAPTIADAVHLLGLDDTVTAADLASAISTEQAARIAADNAEIAARTAADAHLQSQIDAINALIAGLPGPGTPAVVQHSNGIVYTAADGHGRVTFTTPFTAIPAVVVTAAGVTFDLSIADIMVDMAGFDVYWAYPNPAVGGPSPEPTRAYYWIASGPT